MLLKTTAPSRSPRSVPWKLLEHICHYPLSRLEANKILTNLNHGFRSRFSRETASDNSQRPDTILQQWRASRHGSARLLQSLRRGGPQETPTQSATLRNNWTTVRLADVLPDQPVNARCTRRILLQIYHCRRRSPPGYSAWALTVSPSHHWPYWSCDIPSPSVCRRLPPV